MKCGEIDRSSSQKRYCHYHKPKERVSIANELSQNGAAFMLILKLFECDSFIILGAAEMRFSCLNNSKKAYILDDLGETYLGDAYHFKMDSHFENISNLLPILLNFMNY